TRPEGFWWFRSGECADEKLREDLQERLPKFYGDRGYVDFQVLDDTLVVNDTTGKATLVVRVSEGEPYRAGSFEIVGNRRFSTEELQQLFPFKGGDRTGFLGLGGTQQGPTYFSQQKWDDATQQLRTLYYNNGYIYVNVRPEVIRRTGADGKPVVDLRWAINEGQPAIVNKIEISGNDVTHERVIREAIILLPGDVFRQDALIRSYQNISNLGFFQQPLPFPDTRPANDQGDVDVIFRVTQLHTVHLRRLPDAGYADRPPVPDRGNDALHRTLAIGRPAGWLGELPATRSRGSLVRPARPAGRRGQYVARPVRDGPLDALRAGVRQLALL